MPEPELCMLAAWSPLKIQARLLAEYYMYVIPAAALRGCREDPSRELDFTTARRHLTAEVNQVREIYEQLVAWGLINYTARQQAHPDGLDPLELVPDGELAELVPSK